MVASYPMEALYFHQHAQCTQVTLQYMSTAPNGSGLGNYAGGNADMILSHTLAGSAPLNVWWWVGCPPPSLSPPHTSPPSPPPIPSLADIASAPPHAGMQVCTGHLNAVCVILCPCRVCPRQCLVVGLARARAAPVVDLCQQQEV